MFEKINKIKNVYLLDNEIYFDEQVRFIGINPDYEYYHNKEDPSYLIKYLNKKYKEVYSDLYNIAICHSPISIVRKEVLKKVIILNNVDLIVSGHMHAGLTPNILQPFLKNRGLISPKKGIFPAFAYGHIKQFSTDVIITSGITKLSHSNKFHHFNSLFSSEICSIKINKK